MQSVLQTLLSSLLDDNPLTEKAVGKGLNILKAHFTFTAHQINTAFGDSYADTLNAQN